MSRIRKKNLLRKLLKVVIGPQSAVDREFSDIVGADDDDDDDGDGHFVNLAGPDTDYTPADSEATLSAENEFPDVLQPSTDVEEELWQCLVQIGRVLCSSVHDHVDGILRNRFWTNGGIGERSARSELSARRDAAAGRSAAPMSMYFDDDKVHFLLACVALRCRRVCQEQ